MIPPQEIGKKAFTRAGRGYETSEVDEYMDFLIAKYTDIYKQCEIYDKKLRIVSQKIAEIQEREDEIQSKEETISKTMMSSQMIHDRIMEEAQGAADEIKLQAEKAADKILEDARERARTAFEAVNKKTETQIESAREKSESLYLAARTRCAKLLGDFKKEISSKKERMASLKEAADNFNHELSEAYKNQFEAIKSAAVYAPVIDFDRLTETRLFNMIMEEIKEDMAEIEDKNGEAEYEFEKELMLLRNFDFAEEHIKAYKSGVSGSFDFKLAEDIKVEYESEEAVNTAAENEKNVEIEDDDMKVFAGSVNFSEPESYDSGEVVIAEEEPIATYDSDDYQEEHDSAGEIEYAEDVVYENEADENEEESTGGILGFFKGFGKKKKAAWSEDIDESDDIDNIYGELDDEDDDKVMSIFDGLDEEED